MPEYPENVQEDTRASEDTVRIPCLSVSGEISSIYLRWHHDYEGTYEYVYIFRSLGKISLAQRPEVVIPMGTDPFNYALHFWYPDVVGTWHYQTVYYQVAGVTINSKNGINDVNNPEYIINWITPVVQNRELYLKPGIPGQTI